MAVIIAMSSMQLAMAAHHPLHCTKWQNNCQKYDLHCTTKPKSCCDILKSYESSGDFFQEQINNTRVNDVYLLKSPRSTYSTISYLAYCDMTTAEGGWTVIMRRSDVMVEFNNKNYDEYEEGFGDLNHDFFYGLKALNELTNQTDWTLRIDFYNRSNDTDSSAYVTYDNFKVGCNGDGYRLKLGMFEPSEPTLLDSLRGFDEQTFVARKQGENEQNCADNNNESGWWYNSNCINPGGSVLTEAYHSLSWYVTNELTERIYGKYELKIRQNECLSS